ncbi:MULTISPECIES: hypothetical protein [unclassified Psychrobacillus]|uniref:hypothetical protein n=1 Tax=unclassified Psychrobacillus TaxID=2636677 RepID=UPI00146D8E9F|nr:MULTISPECIES: hypothetical protein [unclassified Psychrobacillus]MCM3357584.1 hypothetical protein [Psychrobacillus sp. MER TA 171]NME04759.1 hypothetical protein [Psychrobacillus sp. BL-248-WT-3]
MEDIIGLFIGLVAIVMVFSIPLTAIWTTHLRKMQSMKSKVIKDEIELERLKYDNFLLETEKMRLDLQNKQASLLEMSADPLVVELQKRPKAETQAL